MKDYLGYENKRNKDHAELYVRMIQKAFADEGNCEVLIGHHVTFEVNGVLSSENEIPSADTMMFDHDIMTRVFGTRAFAIMAILAATPCNGRDMILFRALANEETLGGTWPRKYDRSDQNPPIPQQGASD